MDKHAALLTYIVAITTLCVMELTMSQAATETAVSVRSLQRAVQNGSLQASRQVGTHLLVDDIALSVWVRSQGRGRRWNDSTSRDALALLDQKEACFTTGTALSRLRGRLRQTTIPQLAYLVGGIAGRWNRYRSSETDLSNNLRLIGPSKANAHQLGLFEGTGWMTFAEVDNIADLEIDLGFLRDPSGNVGVVERARTDGESRTLLDTYLLGDARESSLAQHRLEAKLPT